MKSQRILRQTEVPAPFRSVDYQDAAKLPRIELDEELYIEYSASAPSFVGGMYPNPDATLDMLRRQECTAWVFLNGSVVGGAVLKRYMIPPYMDNDEFLELMDADSGAEHELSAALDSQFGEIGGVGAYGDVLLLDRMWLARIPRLAGLSAEMVNALVSAFCPEFAIIILKAYPLEYEGMFSENADLSEREVMFQKRRRAMMRLYEREFGVVALRTEYGENGWMYRVRTGLEDIIE
jgi:hypothetical protein